MFNIHTTTNYTGCLYDRDRDLSATAKLIKSRVQKIFRPLCLITSIISVAIARHHGILNRVLVL
jgi:hypothetical protein